MEFEVSYTLDDEQQFWDELDDIVSAHCQTQLLIDHALKSYLRFTSSYKREYLKSEYDIARCSYRLRESPFFSTHGDYVRQQIIHTFLQESATDTLHLLASFLLFDGRQSEKTFELMKDEGAFPRLLELVQSRPDDDLGLYRITLDLLYEMSRIQRLPLEDLRLIDDAFITYLFGIIEELSNDSSDPYHYPVIRVLLVLNEQYMLAAHDPNNGESMGQPLTNKVIKVLSIRGSAYKTFGENIILLLNRESETSLQLLILKLLYLLFTTHATREYFYTNDLRVLVDVIVRNLLDLPDESEALRHMYLRVLYPLLAYTQLRHPPHYKREEIQRLLQMLSHVRSAHFKPVDKTTVRLANRCGEVRWLANPEKPENAAKFHLGMTNSQAKESSLSVVEVASLKERPGVMTPSRNEVEVSSALRGSSATADVKAKANGSSGFELTSEA
ncbi:hypothetical protein FGG08_003464 [Glutinoglossum americanum]|uniref:SPIN90/Ldb17 leucine-rich domain-containing protein n=1 Tax=Glutinoglossum americanum TaxID=1670608 RepID=A0A9P8I477_9PEZI|nr:hypothetical protein FGG08_003464 [Glutinoglossum americanum]